MKRIVKFLVCWITVSMFFTGCSIMLNPSELETFDAAEIAAQNAELNEGDVKIRYEDGAADRELPDYQAKNEEEKFDGLTGKKAFQAKSGHSTLSEDMEGFQIGDLFDDGTFLYCYVTRVDTEGASPRPVVHCAALYNYRTETLNVIHENEYTRSWENAEEEPKDEAAEIEAENESFYVQSCPNSSGGYDIFVYDNGFGYVYDQQGTLLFQTNIESFVRNQFANAYSVTTAQARTNGNGKIYLELTVETEKVDTPENPEADMSDEEPDEEELDEEAEEMESELESKVETLLLVYDFIPLTTTIDQENEAFTKQKNAWIAMTDGKEFTSAPDATADWQTAVRGNPDDWGGAWLAGYKNAPVYYWKNGQVHFQKSLANLSTFIPLSTDYEEFDDVREGARLAGTFLFEENRWYALSGTVGTFTSYEPKNISRTYTYVYEKTTTDAEGNETTETKKELRRQSIRVQTRRKAPLSSSWLEGYWLFSSNDAALGGISEGKVLCTEGRFIYWLNPDATSTIAGFLLDEDMTADVFTDGGITYKIQYNAEEMVISEDFFYMPDWISTSGRYWRIPYKYLTTEYEKGSSEYDDAFHDLNDSSMGSSIDVYSNADHYDAKQVLKADVTEADGTVWDGFLLTSRNKGILCYDPAGKEVRLLVGGCWYRTWKQGDTCISVGFSNSGSSYEGMDVIHARVYEYNLQDLFTASEMEPDDPQAPGDGDDPASEESRAAESETPAYDMLENWEKDYKKPLEDGALKDYDKKGADFDKDAFEAEQAEKEANEEADREKRIEEILSGLGDMNRTEENDGE